MIRTKSTVPAPKPEGRRKPAAPALPAPKPVAIVEEPPLPVPVGEKTMLDDWTPELKDLIKAAGVSRQEAADALRVQKNTLDCWLKPATSKSANPTPMWAVELFRYKFKGRLILHAASQKN